MFFLFLKTPKYIRVRAGQSFSSTKQNHNQQTMPRTRTQRKRARLALNKISDNRKTHLVLGLVSKWIDAPGHAEIHRAGIALIELKGYATKAREGSKEALQTYSNFSDLKKVSEYGRAYRKGMQNMVSISNVLQRVVFHDARTHDDRKEQQKLFDALGEALKDK